MSVEIPEGISVVILEETLERIMKEIPGGIHHDIYGGAPDATVGRISRDFFWKFFRRNLW